jgi:hypothetical protein
VRGRRRQSDTTGRGLLGRNSKDQTLVVGAHEACELGGRGAGREHAARQNQGHIRAVEERIRRLRRIVQFAARRLGEPKLDEP